MIGYLTVLNQKKRDRARLQKFRFFTQLERKSKKSNLNLKSFKHIAHMLVLDNDVIDAMASCQTQLPNVNG
jgi:hypothetical protein